MSHSLTLVYFMSTSWQLEIFSETHLPLSKTIEMRLEIEVSEGALSELARELSRLSRSGENFLNQSPGLS